MTSGRHVFISGFMGAGKSTVGVQLAEAIQRPFIDLDLEIEGAAGQSISSIFEREGESGFRLHERSVLLEAFAQVPSVIALGGGAVVAVGQRHEIRQNGWLVTLSAPFGELQRRVACHGGRPLWDDKVEARFEARAAAYTDADAVVDTAGLTPEAVTQRVRAAVEALEAKGRAS